ncbi:hypothetical protein WA026_017060 [Henosepilachna vigintioctopunctata]|uniref:Uncharacterized protein n=1 Tax=Henosepilachna vigintioctopunctata TaxID=420089 RepID=A0AAW1TV73_9CUCU
MAEEEEGEITEKEIGEEEENNEEPITAEDLKQMVEENDVLIGDILEEKPEDQIISEADNEGGGIEDSVMEGEEREQGDTIENANEEDGVDEQEIKKEGTAEEGMEEEGAADEGMPEEGEEDAEKKETGEKEEIIEKDVIEEKLEKPPESVALKGRIDDKTMKRLEQVEKEVNEAANSIYILKGKAEELLKKEKMTENEEKELEEVNAELKRQMDLFDEKTKEIQDIIANTNILETMPVRLPQVRHEEDVLPRVLLCGEVEDYVPKLIVCHQKIKVSSGSTRECMPECPGPSPPTATTAPKKKCGNDEVQEAICVKNSDIGKMRSLLEEDISNKDKILDNLKLNLESLQNEINMVSAENTELSERLRKLQQNQIRQKTCAPREPKKMCPSLMAAKLQEYSEYARKLEKQLAEMETDFKNVHKEICAAQKERDRREQARNSVAKQFCKKK